MLLFRWIKTNKQKKQEGNARKKKRAGKNATAQMGAYTKGKTGS
jgi:hypothetical protein